MRLGTSLFLVAVGAILKFAVTKQVSGVNVNTVGIVLMVVGIVGLVLSLLFRTTARRRTDVVHHGTGTTYIEPVDPTDPGY
jgi:hypothetical protein